MKQQWIALAGLLACAGVARSAPTADFAERVALAKRNFATSQGAEFEATMMPNIGAAIRACAPPGSTDVANLGAFTLVGSLASDGVLQAIEVQPITSVASCFAEQFGKLKLPPPPPTAPGTVYPIVVVMRVVL